MNHKFTMKDMPASERPYEKCEKYGPYFLSDAELLSVIIRTGSNNQCSTDLAKNIILSAPEQNLAGISQMSLEQLQEIHGIGRVKSIQLQCLAELSKRMMNTTTCNEPCIGSSSREVAQEFMTQMKFYETEHVLLLILDSKGAIKNRIEISHGSFNASLASPREIFYNAIKHKAVSIMLIHNHPSGDPTPSYEDILLTRRLVYTGQMMDISLLDHIIIGDNCYQSMLESGYLDSPDLIS